MQKDFWNSKPSTIGVVRGKRVLVTGAGGFVGTHLAKKLVSVGADVVATSRQRDGIDVTRKETLEPIFKQKLAVVFHLAGEAIVEAGQEAPYETFRTNIMGTLNILELSRMYGVQRVIIASSVQVYGAGLPPFREDDPPLPSRPYETSKTATDLLAQSYADSFGLPVVIPRFVNIYGPGDTHFTRLIPKTLDHLVKNKPMPLWGGSAKREYLYIDDATQAYLLLATISDAKLERNRIFNFGTDLPVSVRDLIQTIGTLAGTPVRLVRSGHVREHEISDQYVSWEKAGRILGWKPKVSLTEGLKRTIDWYKQYLIHEASSGKHHSG